VSIDDENDSGGDDDDDDGKIQEETEGVQLKSLKKQTG